MISGETSGEFDGKMWLRKLPSERADEWGELGAFDGRCRVRRCPLKGKNAGADKQGEMGGKVAEIEFFDVGNHAENGQLSTDNRTKSSDKRFVLKKTNTALVVVPRKTTTLSLSICPGVSS